MVKVIKLVEDYMCTAVFSFIKYIFPGKMKNLATIVHERAISLKINLHSSQLTTMT